MPQQIGVSRSQLGARAGDNFGQGMQLGQNAVQFGMNLGEQQRQFNVQQDLEVLGTLAAQSPSGTFSEALVSHPDLGMRLINNLGWASGPQQAQQILQSIQQAPLNWEHRLQAILSHAGPQTGGGQQQQAAPQPQPQQPAPGPITGATRPVTVPQAQPQANAVPVSQPVQTTPAPNPPADRASNAVSPPTRTEQRTSTRTVERLGTGDAGDTESVGGLYQQEATTGLESAAGIDFFNSVYIPLSDRVGEVNRSASRTSQYAPAMTDHPDGGNLFTNVEPDIRDQIHQNIRNWAQENNYSKAFAEQLWNRMYDAERNTVLWDGRAEPRFMANHSNEAIAGALDLNHILQEAEASRRTAGGRGGPYAALDLVAPQRIRLDDGSIIERPTAQAYAAKGRSPEEFERDHHQYEKALGKYLQDRGFVADVEALQNLPKGWSSAYFNQMRARAEANSFSDMDPTAARSVLDAFDRGGRTTYSERDPRTGDYVFPRVNRETIEETQNVEVPVEQQQPAPVETAQRQAATPPEPEAANTEASIQRGQQSIRSALEAGGFDSRRADRAAATATAQARNLQQATSVQEAVPSQNAIASMWDQMGTVGGQRNVAATTEGRLGLLDLLSAVHNDEVMQGTMALLKNSTIAATRRDQIQQERLEMQRIASPQYRRELDIQNRELDARLAEATADIIQAQERTVQAQEDTTQAGLATQRAALQNIHQELQNVAAEYGVQSSYWSAERARLAAMSAVNGVSNYGMDPEFYTAERRRREDQRADLMEQINRIPPNQHNEDNPTWVNLRNELERVQTELQGLPTVQSMEALSRVQYELSNTEDPARREVLEAELEQLLSAPDVPVAFRIAYNADLGFDQKLANFFAPGTHLRTGVETLDVGGTNTNNTNNTEPSAEQQAVEDWARSLMGGQ